MRRLMRTLAASAAAVALGGGLLAAAVPSSALLLVPVQPVTEGGPNRICAWPINYPAAANYSWPDTDAAYYVQSAFMEKGDELIITGRDPKARYWSIQTYNYRDRQVIDSVNDEQITRTGKGSKATWTVRVTTSKSRPGDNVLQGADPFKVPVGRLPNAEDDGHQLTVVIYRVYRSSTGNPSGGVLPRVTVRTKDGRLDPLVPCSPKTQVGPPDNPVILERQLDVPADFVKAPDGPFYPSYDTSYLLAERPYDPESILVVTGRAPRVPADVRYWSLCQNINQRPLPVVDCVSDRDVKLTQGRYTIAIASRAQIPLSERAKYEGVTFVDWGKVNGQGGYEPALLLFRNILPNPKFAYSVDQLDPYEPASPAMGDFAPVIGQVPISEFRAR